MYKPKSLKSWNSQSVTMKPIESSCVELRTKNLEFIVDHMQNTLAFPISHKELLLGVPSVSLASCSIIRKSAAISWSKRQYWLKTNRKCSSVSYLHVVIKYLRLRHGACERKLETKQKISKKVRCISKAAKQTQAISFSVSVMQRGLINHSV